jgi:phage terminase large subunit-like protein
MPVSFDRVVQSWDTANKATELSDFSVCTTWGLKGKNLYLLGVLRKRLEYPDLKRAVREQQSLFSARVVLIEDKASGTQLIQELIVDGCHGSRATSRNATRSCDCTRRPPRSKMASSSSQKPPTGSLSICTK